MNEQKQAHVDVLTRGDAAEEILLSHARAAVAELIEAARKIRMERHTHSAIGALNSEGCGHCEHNWRHEIHYRVGESAEADLAALDAALARVGGAA